MTLSRRRRGRYSAHVLEHSLRLLHPYMPFVTETIWQNLPGLDRARPALIISRWPYATDWRDSEVESQFQRIQDIVRAIRNARSEHGVDPTRRVVAQFSAGEHAKLLSANLDLVANLARLDLERSVVEAHLAAPEKAVTLATGGLTVYLPLAGMVDLDAERQRLQKEIADVERQLERTRSLLNNPGFVGKAPAEVIARERGKLAELEEKRQQMVARLQDV